MQTPKAWVIDKDPTFQTHLRSFLDTIGYSAKCFSDGEESLYHLREKPDFIILDGNLNGDLNGLDVMRTIKVNTAIPLIYLSDEERERLSGQKNGQCEDGLRCLQSKIRKIERFKALKRKRRKSKILVFSIIGAVWAAGLVKFIVNISV
jgi:CheY-like chemotaxis protein